MQKFAAKCVDCGHTAPYTATSVSCPQCGGEWRETVYDFDSLKRDFLTRIQKRNFDLWRYHDLLPVNNPDPSISMGEGGTPLIQAHNLGMMLGLPNLFIKDERQGPTTSFKDRQAAVTIAALKEAGVSEAVIASTGNVAISYSAYAARAGIKLWAFITSLVPPVKMREVALYGTQVIKVTGNYDEAKQVAAEFAKERALYVDRGVRSITTVDAMKTITFEVSEQLTNLLRDKDPGSVPDKGFVSPDWYIQSVSGGMGPVGVLKGYDELEALDLIEKRPKIAAIQAAGCAPMVHAWHAGKEVADPVLTPRTHIATLATGDPGRTYTFLRERMLAASGGTFESVSDEEAFKAMHILAKMEGMSIEPATGVAFAGLIKMVRSGQIKPTDTVVVNLTGHTIPVEQEVIGDNWATDIEFPLEGIESATPAEDGLLAALNRVTDDRYPRVAIVDDHPHVRLLIRRILQAQGKYELFEAEDGQSALKMIHAEKPDLIILDLMMPEMDGFSVLDALRADPATSSIPVIVVTAQELTVKEKQRLEGQIQSLMQKGDFISEDLLEEVRSLIE